MYIQIYMDMHFIILSTMIRKIFIDIFGINIDDDYDNDKDFIMINIMIIMIFIDPFGIY
jgi:hypothetical protein